MTKIFILVAHTKLVFNLVYNGCKVFFTISPFLVSQVQTGFVSIIDVEKMKIFWKHLNSNF